MPMNFPTSEVSRDRSCFGLATIHRKRAKMSHNGCDVKKGYIAYRCELRWLFEKDDEFLTANVLGADIKIDQLFVEYILRSFGGARGSTNSKFFF